MSDPLLEEAQSSWDGWDASELLKEVPMEPADEKDLKAWMLEALDKVVRARRELVLAKGLMFPRGSVDADLERAWEHLQAADAALASLLPGAEPVRR